MKKLAFLTVFLALSSFIASAQVAPKQSASTFTNADVPVINEATREGERNKFNANIKAELGLTDAQMQTLQPILERMRKGEVKTTKALVEIKKALKSTITPQQAEKLDAFIESKNTVQRQ